jgi:TolA-binding protein
MELEIEIEMLRRQLRQAEREIQELREAQLHKITPVWLTTTRVHNLDTADSGASAAHSGASAAHSGAAADGRAAGSAGTADWRTAGAN